MQILLFSDQESSITFINVSHVVKVALPLVLCQSEIKMASNMIAKIIKQNDFLGGGSVFAVLKLYK